MVVMSRYTLALASGAVFLLLNVAENLIHFSIGRNVAAAHDVHRLRFIMPTLQDGIRITGVMLLFAALHVVIMLYVIPYRS
jgi:uncharacterized membrane protein